MPVGKYLEKQLNYDFSHKIICIITKRRCAKMDVLLK